MRHVLETFSPTALWWSKFVLAVVKLNPSPAVQAVVDIENASDFFLISFPTLLESPLFDQCVEILNQLLETDLAIPVLNLIEYMDFAGTPLPLSLESAARAAERHGQWPKALYFREIEFKESPTNSECIESLIASNIKLGLRESVQGLLRSGPVVEFIRVRPGWHEKLHNWTAALNAYTIRLLHAPHDVSLQVGRMNCLAQLGEWNRLLRVASEYKDEYYFNAACFHAQLWSKMVHQDDLFEGTELATTPHHLLRLAGVVAQGNYALARSLLGTAKPSTALQRVQLTQMEELMTYCSAPTCTREDLMKIWEARLHAMEYSLEVWRALIPLRALVVCPFTEDVDIWVRYSTIARKKDALVLSDGVVAMLEADPRSASHHGVVLARIKNLYAAGKLSEAIERLDAFLKSSTGHVPRPLLAKCSLALGLWLPHMDMRVPQLLARSAALDPSSYKSRSALALSQFKDLRPDSPPLAVANTVQSLFTCIALAPTAPLQDVLRIITLWFKWYDVASEAFETGFGAVPLKTWLQATPQILARLRGPQSPLRDSIARLITRVGLAYPQSLVFPLTVAASSSDSCLSVLESLTATELVAETKKVCTELVRISISWIEQWSALLEEASRLYFVTKDIPAMVAVLDRGVLASPSALSLHESQFLLEYGSALHTANAWIEKAGVDKDVDSSFYREMGWKIYYQVFQQLHAIPTPTSFQLRDASPELVAARDLALWIPGTEVPLAAFEECVEVLGSKQKPRIVRMLGSDGKEYQFLLKGNEDLKQDERVMQLFRLINAVVADAAATRRRSGVFPATAGIETLDSVPLRTFAVVPLSPIAGLIEWVPGCDTLHGLIKARRSKDSVPLSIEHNLMRAVYPKYEELPLIDRIQIFQSTLAQTSGDELSRSMWIGSGSCEHWLRQRVAFSRSLAVTSIVGYILGLGDRHPSNLMISHATGQVIHIDFGDCFDVAATRERFPERIPFRLTRQLINALEVGGVDGTFRITAERMSDLMRKNIDTILAMLDAFVNDPLLAHANHPQNLVDRVHAKLSGEEYGGNIPLQVKRLIHEATAPENLCQCYLGWCPFW